LAQITNLTKGHPIEKELAEGGCFQLEKTFKKRVKTHQIKQRETRIGIHLKKLSFGY